MNQNKKAYRAAAQAYLAGDHAASRSLYVECRAKHGVGKKAKAIARQQFEKAVKRQRIAQQRAVAWFKAFDPSI